MMESHLCQLLRENDINDYDLILSIVFKDGETALQCIDKAILRRKLQVNVLQAMKHELVQRATDENGKLDKEKIFKE